uniref:FIIND domain-containing protein n=1 Tax=Terrapene triunguis TaxID=2587831 RepID=A0A674IT71_9SAUR
AIFELQCMGPVPILGGPQLDSKINIYIFKNRAGSFRCSETELGFEVRAAVTLKYNYESWHCHQTELDMQQWMIAGPLFNIWAEPAGAVAALYLPHFMCLAGGEAGVSQMRMAHFVDGRMTLEEPTRVMPFHAVLENPRFSLWGAILKKGKAMLSSSIHGITLLYRALRAENITLHLYLIPDILPLRKVIDDNERKYKSIRVRKPPTTKPLTYGSHYAVSSTSNVEITPEVSEIIFCASMKSLLQLSHGTRGRCAAGSRVGGIVGGAFPSQSMLAPVPLYSAAGCCAQGILKQHLDALKERGEEVAIIKARDD